MTLQHFSQFFSSPVNNMLSFQIFIIFQKLSGYIVAIVTIRNNVCKLTTISAHCLKKVRSRFGSPLYRRRCTQYALYSKGISRNIIDMSMLTLSKCV